MSYIEKAEEEIQKEFDSAVVRTIKYIKKDIDALSFGISREQERLKELESKVKDLDSASPETHNLCNDYGRTGSEIVVQKK